MKAARWAAAALGLLIVLTYLAPFAVTIDSEGAVWFAFIVLAVAWYLIGPALLASATVCAAISSVLYVRASERSARLKHAVVWSWVAWFVFLTGVAVFLLPKNHPYPDLFIAILFTAIPATAGVSMLAVAANARTRNDQASVVLRWHVVVGFAVLLVALVAVALLIYVTMGSVPSTLGLSVNPLT